MKTWYSSMSLTLYAGASLIVFSRISPNIFSTELAGRNHPLSKNRRNLCLWNACPSANPQSSEKYMVCAATRLSLTLNSWQTKCRNYPELIFLLAELNLLWFAPSLRMFVGLITKRIQAFCGLKWPSWFFGQHNRPFGCLKSLEFWFIANSSLHA